MPAGGDMLTGSNDAATKDKFALYTFRPTPVTKAYRQLAGTFLQN
jgi:hypothetical protein